MTFIKLNIICSKHSLRTHSTTRYEELEITECKRIGIPGIDGAPTPRPIAPPPETEACATVVGFDIQPARGIGTGAGVG